MKNKQNKISNPKFGMFRARSSYLLEDNSYTFMLNGQSVDESGNRLTLSNEHSNILASRFKSGFYVIGKKTDIIRNRTYFFLVNPSTNVSEIGYIQNKKSFSQQSDIQGTGGCDDCIPFLNLSEPLENIIQSEHQSYVTILEDSCNNCLNFNIDYPIFDIEIKTENIGEVMFFTDGLNEVRYVRLDDLDPYGYVGEEICGTGSETPTCLDCDKLRVFPLYINPKVQNCSRSFGGSLKKGVYEIYFAYTDELGNERTSYTPIVSPPISIFDESDVIFEQDENSSETNFSIKVELSDLDNRFTHYKIIVAENTSQTVDQGSLVYRDKGVFSVSDTIVLVSSNIGDVVSANKVLVPLPSIDTWKGLTASNNFLFGYGIKEKVEINLQPVFNLMGSLVQWQSSVAKDNLYSKAIGNKFKGYNRDEVYPIGIKPISNDGYIYPVFPLISRPSDETDIEEVDNTDTQSITNVADNCDSLTRNKRWQFYNTATEEGTCSGFDVPTTTQPEIVTAITAVDVPSVPSGTIDIEGDNAEGFVDLQTYINDNAEACDCDPNPACYSGKPLESICSYLDLSNLTAFNEEPTLDTECGSPSLISEYVQATTVTNEVATYEPKDEEDYINVRPPEGCEVYLGGEDNIDESFSSAFLLKNRDAGIASAGIELNPTVKKKLYVTYAESCAEAIVMQNVNNINFSNYTPVSYVHPYFGGEKTASTGTFETDYAELLDSRDSDDSGTLTDSDIGGSQNSVFSTKLHKGALWFKMDINDRDTFWMELTRMTEPNAKSFRMWINLPVIGDAPLHYFSNDYIRYNIYANCTDSTPIKGEILRLNAPHLVEITSSDIAQSSDGYLYVAIDLPITATRGVGLDAYYDDDPVVVLDTAVTVPLASCFSVNTRDEEYAKITVSYDSIDLEKIQTYQATCIYEVPIPTDCEPIPFKYGKFGFCESTENYPDNEELYDSSTLEINNSDIPVNYRADFESYYVDSVNGGGDYTLNEDATKFLCKPIRHFKFPDNNIAPFIYYNRIGRDANTVIYPLGVKIDDELFNSFMDIAVNNSLISQERRDKIIGYEVYRGDRQLSKSVLSSGLLFDMRTYSDNSNREVRYSNFPYNALGKDKLNTELNGSEINLGSSNHLFTYHSPESDYYQSDRPTEISVQGYQFGKCVTTIAEVEDHPKWVILGSKARSLATTLAIAEVIAEAAVNIAQSAEVYRVQVGVANSANPVGIGLNIAVAALQALTSIVSKVGRYRYEWLKIFRDLGTPKNFAYFSTSTGKYNYLRTLQQEGNMLRGVANATNLKSGFFTLTENTTGEAITINNIDREESLFISFTETYELDHSDPQYGEYINHDDNDVSYNSSQVVASEFSCVSENSPEIYRNIASPYIAIKSYNPNQYGTIDSVRWLYTGYTSDLSEDNCGLVLGGDIFISPHSIKRKMPIFSRTAFELGDLTPYAYGLYKNVGKPRFYIDYEVDSEVTSSGTVFPDIDYTLETDCYTGSGGFYVKPPTKFYLYYYGQPLFYTETTINTHFRNARKEPWNQFYPQNQDYVNLTQEKTVSIRRPNQFFYNYNYSYQGTVLSNKTLPPYYSYDLYYKQANNPNTVMYSQQDSSENSISEPWLNYRPNDRYTFPAAYGELKKLKGIESQQVLGTFENQSVIFNAVDSYVDGVTESNRDLGTGGIFARRPRTFNNTDLGYLGTQSSTILSCEYGHFIVDTSRGQIFRINPNGNQVEEISKYSNGKPNGMDIWFKEHLPFKILEDFPELYPYIDNPYNGIGITMGWDSKFKRVFITKKDYKATEGTIYNEDGTFTKNMTQYTLQEAIQKGVLQDVSWTLSYKTEKGGWESYMDFKPNYYVGYSDYFQSGINQTQDSTEYGIWSHLLTNRSKQVFYGKKYPWIIEYPTKNDYVNKKLESITLWTEAKRYHNEYDYAPDDRITFNKVVVFSDRENSGNLNLIPNTGLLSQLSKYPITRANEQDILITQNNKKWTFNHIYNRVKSNRNNVPLFLYDENQINKQVNTSAVSFYGKNVLEQMSSEVFLIRLTQDKTSQYDLEFKFASQKEEIS